MRSTMLNTHFYSILFYTARGQGLHKLQLAYPSVYDCLGNGLSMSLATTSREHQSLGD